MTKKKPSQSHPQLSKSGRREIRKKYIPDVLEGIRQPKPIGTVTGNAALEIYTNLNQFDQNAERGRKVGSPRGGDVVKTRSDKVKDEMKKEARQLYKNHPTWDSNLVAQQIMLTVLPTKFGYRNKPSFRISTIKKYIAGIRRQLPASHDPET